MRILVADDQEKISKHLKSGLEAEGYAVDLAFDGDEALWLARNHPYDVILMDIRMPAKDGITVVRELRRSQNNTPIILLTGVSEINDRIAGLDAGADDYLIKPVSLNEIIARLRAQIRRVRPNMTNVLRVADLELDLISRHVTRAGKTRDLTNREFAILEVLMSHAPKVVSKSALIEHVWDQTFDSETNTLNVHIKHLRDKIGDGQRPLIHTVRNVGYCLKDASEPVAEAPTFPLEKKLSASRKK